jgi:uncharacterized protein (TIGR03067 family)
MYKMLCMVAFLTASNCLCADDKDDVINKLNGTYSVISVLKDGKPVNDKKDTVTFTIENGTLSVKEGEKQIDRPSNFSIEPTKQPAHINVRPDIDPDERVLGIYELKETEKGMELTIAFGERGGERPKDFKGEGKGSVVVKLFRKKEK